MNRGSFGRRRAYRSGFRGRSSRPQQLSSPQVRSVPTALGPELCKKALAQIQDGSLLDEVEISDCEFLASYNLIEGHQKTILVPGEPPMWTPLPRSTTLSPDSGEYYRDDNAARFPDYPMEPAVKSIFTMNPAFDSSEINVFGCGSTLGNILRFANGAPQPFSFTVHLIGNTAFLVRRNHSPTELIDDVHGYGHSFPEAYTTWSQDVKGSTSHQRIIKYSFGGLTCLVRFEADGFILDHADDSESDELTVDNVLSSGKPAAAFTATTNAAMDVLLEGLSRNTFSTRSLSTEQIGGQLIVRAQGRRTPQLSVFDLKTRSARKQRVEIMEEQLPRLWVRQIHKFILAFHTSGRFDTPEVLDVSSEIYEWERKSKAALGRMATLLKDICETAKSVEGGTFEVRGNESSTLQFHRLSTTEMEKFDVLPDALRKQWE